MRKRKAFLDRDRILRVLSDEKTDTGITFYGGDPLLHPNITEIVRFCREKGYRKIGILTNTGSLDESGLEDLLENGLNSVGIYFNSFNEEVHKRLTGG